MKIVAKALKAIASVGSKGTVGCWHFWIDEPKMPRSLIEK